MSFEKGGWDGGVGWGWDSRQFVLRSLDCMESHRNLMGRTCITLNIELDALNGWISGLASMGQGKVCYGRVKEYLMPRGAGQLRDCYMHIIAYFLSFLCTQRDYIFQPPLKFCRVMFWVVVNRIEWCIPWAGLARLVCLFSIHHLEV